MQSSGNSTRRTPCLAAAFDLVDDDSGIERGIRHAQLGRDHGDADEAEGGGRYQVCEHEQAPCINATGIYYEL